MRVPPLIAAAALAGAVLAGCSSEPVPKEPDDTPSSSPTPTSTASPPAMPEAATQNTAEGAAAFLDHYLDVMNYASHTGDVEPLRDLSLDTCTGCQIYIGEFAQLADQGGKLEGGDWSAGRIELQNSGDQTVMVTTVTLAAGRYTESRDAEPRDIAETSEDATFSAKFSGEHWSMAQLAAGRRS